MSRSWFFISTTSLQVSRYHLYPPIEASYPKLDSIATCATVIKKEKVEADDNEVRNTSGDKRLPGTLILKGIIWPGMNLFDAAPEEAKRMRNQKKHYSVVQMLERNSAMVEATETVSSADRIMLKQRAMEDLENDSPVEGEFMVRKPPVKKRKASAPRKPRPNKQNKKQARQPKRRGQAAARPVTPDNTVATDSAHVVFGTNIDSSEDEGPAYKEAVRNSLMGNFVLYDEQSSNQAVDSTRMDTTLSDSVNAMQHQDMISMSKLPVTPTVRHIKREMLDTPDMKTTISPIQSENLPFFAQFGSSNAAMSTYPLPYTPTRQLDVLPPKIKDQRINPLGLNLYDTFSAQDDYLSTTNPSVPIVGDVDRSIKMESVDSDEFVPEAFTHYH